MGVWDGIVNSLIDIGGSAGKDLLTTVVRDKIVRPSLEASKRTSAQGDSLAVPDFCPYCSVAKHMAAVHLYLSRAHLKPDLASVYVTLASSAATDALAIASLVSETPAPRQMNLIKSLTEMDIRLSSPINKANIATLASRALAVANYALGLAEFSNIGELEAPKEVAAPQGEVVEGEFKVVEETERAKE